MNLLSIQSHVTFGHVGNSAAVFPLQRLGSAVWPVHTVHFSNHPGYGRWRGRVADAGTVRDAADGLTDLGVLATCDGVLSGYLGAVEIGEAALDAVARVKQANPSALYCCDPVIGDAKSGVYVGAGIPAFMRERAIPAADVATPNQFELEHLCGCKVGTLRDLAAAIETVHARGPRVILVTSVRTAETPDEAIDLVVSDPSGRFRLRTPLLPLAANGAGDAIAAIFFFHLLRDGSAAEALSRAGSAVFGVLARTAQAGARELLLVAAQDEIVAPGRVFQAERLGF